MPAAGYIYSVKWCVATTKVGFSPATLVAAFALPFIYPPQIPSLILYLQGIQGVVLSLEKENSNGHAGECSPMPIAVA